MGKIHFAKAVGSYVNNAWVGCEVVEGVDEGVVVVVRVRGGEQQLKLEAVGSGVVKELKGVLVGARGEDGGGLLEAVEEVVGGVEELEIDVGVVVFEKEKVFLLGKGMGVCLWRGGRWGVVLGWSDELQFLQGELKKEDVFVVGVDVLKNELESGRGLVMGEEDDLVRRIDKLAESLVVWMGVKQVENVVGVVAGWVEGKEDKKEVLDKRKRQVFGGWLRRPKVLVRTGGENKRKKWLGRVVLGVLVVLVVSVLWGLKVRRDRLVEERLGELLAPVEGLYQRALADKVVNPLRARTVLGEARGLLEEKLGEVNEGSVEYAELMVWWEKVQSEYKEVSGEVETEPGVYLDLGLVESEFYGSVMDRVGEWVVIVDSNQGKMMKVGVVNKQAGLVLESGDLQGVSRVAGVGERVYVLKDAGVWGLTLDGVGLEKEIDQDETWDRIVGLGVYGDNVYVFDGGEGEIWRYRPRDDGWVRQRWLAPGVAPDFSETVEMVIDGNIWMLDSDGVVREYAQGVSTGFGLSGLEENGLEACCLGVWGEEESKRVYVLDKGGGRVVEYGAGGEYIRQFRWEGMGGVSDMVTVEGKILLLAGERLLEIEL